MSMQKVTEIDERIPPHPTHPTADVDVFMDDMDPTHWEIRCSACPVYVRSDSRVGVLKAWRKSVGAPDDDVDTYAQRYSNLTTEQLVDAARVIANVVRQAYLDKATAAFINVLADRLEWETK